MTKKTELCCICGKPFDDELKMGNNALPYREGRCCSKCNRKYVIPSREFAIKLRNNVVHLFNEKQKEVESKEYEPLYNTQDIFGFTLNDKGEPRIYKEWKRNFFMDFCRNDKGIKDLETKLISAAKAKLKDANDVWIRYSAEKSDYIIHLLNYSNKHPRK
jgi:hypothetical protein